MNDSDLVSNLESEYYSILAANPDWDQSLIDFLKLRGVTDDQIWEHLPRSAREAELAEPDWL